MEWFDLGQLNIRYILGRRENSFVFCNAHHLPYIPFVSGEDGRSRAEQLLHILRQLDPYVSSSLEHQRRRGCVAVQEVLIKFRNLCSGGFGALGSYPAFIMNKQIDQGGTRSLSSLPCMFNDFL